MTPEPAYVNPVREELLHLREHWLLLFILGIGLVVVGFVAIVYSFVATLVAVAFFGTLLFIGAVIQLVNAVACRNLRGFFIYLLGGVLYGVVGLIMMNQPEGAAAALTLMLAAAFMIGGVLRIIGAAIHHFHGWAWVMLNGFISLFLGVYIWRHFPESAFWVIGLFVGIEFIFAGWSWIFLALGVRSIVPTKP
jgi:uncharacterized membrane protein HdeD (DUF308 family)